MSRKSERVKSKSKSPAKDAQNGSLPAVASRSSRSAFLLVLQVLAIVGITFIAYIPAMKAGYIWDDDLFLTNNPLILAPDGLYRFWFTTEAPDYFPLTSSMLWIEWRLWGGDATGFHVMNILLHILAAILFWRILKLLAVPGAWLAALIFAVHPVAVESVAWITERKNTLPLVLYGVSIICFLHYHARDKKLFYGLSLAAFLLALLSKTSVAMLPIVLVGIVWWMNGKVSKRDWIRILPYFAMAAILSLVTIWFQYNRAIREDVIRTDGLLSRTVLAGWSVWFYLYKAILPIRLSFIYPRWQANTSSPLAYIPLMAIIALLGLFWKRRGSWGRPLLVAFGYFIVTLLPVLGFFNIYFMRYSLVADHWQYTSLIGVIALLTGLSAYYFKRRLANLQPFGVGVAVITVLALSYQTFQQCKMYDNQEVLWRETIRRNPEAWIAYDNLGIGMASLGRYEEAVSLHEKALGLNPENVDTLLNVSVPLSKLGRFEEADRYLEKALRLAPEEPDVQNNIGLSLMLQGKPEEAIEHYEKALELNPNQADAHSNLGNALARMKRYDEALDHFEKALDIYPEHSEANYNLGIVLMKMGRLREAVPYFTRAIDLKPNNPEAYNNLGVICEQVGDLDAALANYRASVQLDPENAQSHGNLIHVLLVKGLFAEAVQHCEFMIGLSPNAKIYEQYGDALIQQERVKEALESYRKALDIQPVSPMLLAKMAMIFATASDPSVRDMGKAVALSETAREQDPDNPIVLDTLGMVYAESGRFQSAEEYAHQAAEFAEVTGQPQLADLIRQKAALYSQGKPYRFDDLMNKQ